MTEPELAPITIDEFSEQLVGLRLAQGRPSYAELASRIARHREAAGIAPERARIARSTVYDVFRPGRKRLDVDLVREILIALGLEEAEVRRWTATARYAVPGVAAPHEGREPAPRTPPPELPQGPLVTDSPGRSPGRTAWLLLACLLLNLLGRQLVVALGLPLHLDMTGTAVAAIMVGPWWGALVGVGTNTVGAAMSGVTSFPFALVNVAGALVWGYGVRRWGMGRTIPRFFALNAIAAFVCSCVATPILVLYRGDIIHASETVTDNLTAIVQVVVLGIFLSNLLISLADKTISGVVALVIVESRSSRSTPLALGGRKGP